MVDRVLVANRGEIARRVFTTCRRLGIDTVAVYTDPDEDSPHAAEADVRVHINSYLDGAAIIAAAVAAGADAIHPGYGFLSENADFADAVITAGLTWIGPPPAAVRAMGSKIESKKIMAAAGVPVLDELDPQTITEAQLPVLVKASAGGGGRGMRVVTTLAELPEQVEAAGREATSAFGDGTVFCERYLASGHHIEVQVMADAHGTVWSVGERECSIQRRHQKIIEEAPSPLVQRVPGMRQKLFDAARTAAEAIGYTGAGTVEFMADDSGDFFFLEMNTRLQVEHPVTEETTGLDLVALQLDVASGARLDPEPPPAQGHSIEARLYAEDPARDWLPQSGVVHRFDVPDGVRVDSGIVDGSVVSIHYDPMLAKVISHAPTRGQAARVLATALARTRLHGIRTNRDLLVNVLRHPAFRDGATDTAFFDTHDLAILATPLPDRSARRLSAVAAALAAAAHNRATATTCATVPGGWRNLPSANQVKTYDIDGEEYRVAYRATRAGIGLPDDADVTVRSTSPQSVVLVDGRAVEIEFDVHTYGADVFVDSALGAVHLVAVPRFVEPGTTNTSGSLLAPMPGVVVRVGAEPGAQVSEGQPLLWLEAMKMEHTVNAPADGVLTELRVGPGVQVEVGQLLAIVNSEGKS